MIIIEPPHTPALAHPPLHKRELQQFLAYAKKAIPIRGIVSVLLTTDSAIRELNRRFRKMDKATDVLSFPAAGLNSSNESSGSRHSQKIAGDLAISLETAARQAASYGHELTLEIKILVLHGLLHLSGLDHETDSGEMGQREQELRRQLDLPLGLIQRSNSEVPRTEKKRSRTAATAGVQGGGKNRVSKARHGAPGIKNAPASAKHGAAALALPGGAKRRSKTP